MNGLLDVMFSGLHVALTRPLAWLFVLFVGQDTLIMMTRDFDPILEVPIHATEFGEGM